MSGSSDKIYILIIFGMFGFFVYWYQLNGNSKCLLCAKSLNKSKQKNKHKKHKKNKTVRFSDTVVGRTGSGKPGSGKPGSEKPDDDVSLDSLESSGKTATQNDSKSCDSLDI